MKKMMNKSEQLRNLLLLLAITSPCVYAQDKVVNYSDKPLYVEGEGAARPAPTDEELQYIDNELNKQGDQIILNSEKSDKYRRLQKTTEKLAGTTEKYVKEKKSSEKKISEYNKKIECLLDEDSSDPECAAFLTEKDERDVIQVRQAAPVQVMEVAAPQEAAPTARFIERLKVIPFLMGTTYSGKDLNNIETKPGFGIKLDADLNKSFTFGLGFSYSSMTIKDVQCQSNNFNNGYGGYNNNYNGNSFNYCNDNDFGGYGYNSNNSNRIKDIQSKNLGIDLTGRFNFAYTDKFIPYVGFGVGWNKLNMQFDNLDTNNVYGNYNNNGYYGIDNNNDYDFPKSHVTSYFSGKIALGADYYFSKMFGANLEFNYSRGVTSLNGKLDKNDPNLFYQRMLEDLGKRISEANALTMAAGAIIAF